MRSVRARLLQTLNAEMKLDFRWFDDNPLDAKDKWTDKRKAAYKKTFISLARATWNAKFTFNNVRDPQSVCGENIRTVQATFKKLYLLKRS